MLCNLMEKTYLALSLCARKARNRRVWQMYQWVGWWSGIPEWAGSSAAGLRGTPQAGAACVGSRKCRTGADLRVSSERPRRAAPRHSWISPPRCRGVECVAPKGDDVRVVGGSSKIEGVVRSSRRSPAANRADRTGPLGSPQRASRPPGRRTHPKLSASASRWPPVPRGRAPDASVKRLVPKRP